MRVGDNMEIIQPVRFEQWKLITENSVPNIIKDAYYISNFGRVYSTFTKRILTLTPTWNGYYRVFLRLNNGTGRYYLVHRIVMIEFHIIDNYSNFQVNHIDCDKSNNDEENLEWVTASENILHAYRSGVKTKAKGEDCSYATITNQQADEIGKLLSTKQYSHKQISEITEVPIHIISNISSGSTWRDIYNKYKLYENKKNFKCNFEDEQLHQLCKYLEIHKNDYDNKSDLYRAALKDLFGIDYISSMSATMSRIYNKKTRTDITNMYNF